MRDLVFFLYIHNAEIVHVISINDQSRASMSYIDLDPEAETLLLANWNDHHHIIGPENSNMN